MNQPIRARAAQRRTNEFRESLAMPMPRSLPTIDTRVDEPPTTRASVQRGTVIMAGFLVTAIVLGILAGQLIVSAAPVAATPAGAVAEVTNPQYARIIQARAVAAAGRQSLQVGQSAAGLQGVTQPALQGADINALQPGLSAYDAQGSVGAAASR